MTKMTKEKSIIFLIQAIAFAPIVIIALYSLRHYGMFNAGQTLEFLFYPAFWAFTNQIESGGEHLWFFDFHGVGWLLIPVISMILITKVTPVLKKIAKREYLSTQNYISVGILLYVLYAINYTYIAALPDIGNTPQFLQTEEEKAEAQKRAIVGDGEQQEAVARQVLAKKLFSKGKKQEAYGVSFVFALLNEHEENRNMGPGQKKDFSGFVKNTMQLHKKYASEFPVIISKSPILSL